MTTSESLLLLDANVVVCLFELGLWDEICAAYDVHVGETILNEALYYRSADGRHRIDLKARGDAGQVTEFTVALADCEAFKG
jgi:hypothetical protein